MSKIKPPQLFVVYDSPSATRKESTILEYSRSTMKRYLATIALMLLCFAAANAQITTRRTIKEVKSKPVTIAAPRQCLLSFREFFSYLQREKPGIVDDERAQKLFLSENLRKAFKEKLASFGNESSNPDYPDNRTFIGSWDYPSTYSVVASRRYGNRAIVDVLYTWGKGTNYPGDERTTSFIFVFEDRMWKIGRAHV